MLIVETTEVVVVRTEVPALHEHDNLLELKKEDVKAGILVGSILLLVLFAALIGYTTLVVNILTNSPFWSISTFAASSAFSLALGYHFYRATISK
jgi:uncharacterized RDD family membrane protein YckC